MVPFHDRTMCLFLNCFLAADPAARCCDTVGSSIAHAALAEKT